MWWAINLKYDDMLVWIWNPNALKFKKVRRKREAHASPLRAEHPLGPHNPDWNTANDIPKTNTSSKWHLNHRRDYEMASHTTLQRLLNFKFKIPICNMITLHGVSISAPPRAL